MPEVNSLEACTYCSWLLQILGGKDGHGHYCLNRNSLYWVESFKLPNRELTPEQRLKSCEKIKFNGNKISGEILRQLPDDSYLRRFPLDEIVLTN